MKMKYLLPVFVAMALAACSDNTAQNNPHPHPKPAHPTQAPALR
ncbi:hypothetical protein [Alysiella crassa]|uniref:Lipoprotein n=1 Tax=Alysiella crassa TaxID=153491 RepID=A0A376BLI7_9NEIS|nr:hypothetical protein [Alysiella crassa]SSY70074.1 Uncharacterised protein [Alysiella crassa]